VVVQDLLKEVAQTQQVDLGAKQRFKVVVINEADHLTRDAQAALRRTMEKYSPNLRLILLANSTSNIIAPIRSRTLLVRVSAPTETEICSVLSKVGKKEGWKDVESLNQRIAKDSGRNLRKALLMFEAVHAQKYGFISYTSSLMLMYQQRENHRPDAHPTARLGSTHPANRPPNRRGAISSTPSASPRVTLRSAIALHRLHDHHKNAYLETHTNDGRCAEA